MTILSDKKWTATSDAAFLELIGSFIRHHRLQQNKTQSQLANEAGIARSTLSSLEKGENSSLITFIQILRTLKLLELLKEFQVKQQISPILLAKIEQLKKSRARLTDKSKSKPKSDW
ncbi:MAG: helix-turn-helix transcriptional regulator [Bacteroidota bacterium]|nr:helix-turn-helix transcriptional regulator [Bacteroidota bacterium]